MHGRNPSRKRVLGLRLPRAARSRGSILRMRCALAPPGFKGRQRYACAFFKVSKLALCHRVELVYSIQVGSAARRDESTYIGDCEG